MRKPAQLLVLCLLLGAPTRGAGQPAAEAWRPRGVTRDGTWFDAALRGVSARGEIEWANPPGRAIPSAELVLWGGYRDRLGGAQLLLVDGSALVVELLRVDAEAVTIVSPLWAETRIPRDVVCAIVFHPPCDVDQRDRLSARAFATERTEPRLLLENGDELGGRLPDEVPPTPGAFRLTHLPWQAHEGGPVDRLSVDRVLAVLLAPSRPPDLTDRTGYTLVGLRDGSQLAARSLRGGTDHLEFELVAGPRLATSPTRSGADALWSPVVSLQPLRQRDVVYLSDLDPISYRQIPFLETAWPYRRDRCASGGRLRHAGYVWAKGLGMHSAARLAYETQGAYREFQSEVALDDRAGRLGSVIFRVYVQGPEGPWRLAYESGLVRGGDGAIPVRVDIRDAQRVALLVDFADRADQADQADWLNARFTRLRTSRIEH